MKKKLVFIIFLFIIIIFLFGFIYPFIEDTETVYIGMKPDIVPAYKITSKIALTNSRSYASVRDYFYFISSLSSFILSILAIILGAFYYFDKRKIESVNRKESQKEHIVKCLMDAHKEYEIAVKSFFESQSLEISAIRQKVNDFSLKHELFENVLEYAKKNLGKDLDTAKFEVSNTCIDKGPAASLIEYKSASEAQLLAWNTEFYDKTKEVGIAIYNIYNI